MTTTTTPLTSQFRTAERIAETVSPEILTINDHGGAFTVSFADPDAAIAAVESAKGAAWSRYVRNGGNPRNKRSHSASFAAIKKAITEASA
jgi:hypothetical protein